MDVCPFCGGGLRSGLSELAIMPEGREEGTVLIEGLPGHICTRCRKCVFWAEFLKKAIAEVERGGQIKTRSVKIKEFKL